MMSEADKIQKTMHNISQMYYGATGRNSVETFKEIMKQLTTYYCCEVDEDHRDSWAWELLNPITYEYDVIEIIILHEDHPAVMFHIKGTKGSVIAYLNEDASEGIFDAENVEFNVSGSDKTMYEQFILYIMSVIEGLNV